jgi:hypothetical protein
MLVYVTNCWVGREGWREGGREGGREGKIVIPESEALQATYKKLYFVKIYL